MERKAEKRVARPDGLSWEKARIEQNINESKFESRKLTTMEGVGGRHRARGRSAIDADALLPHTTGIAIAVESSSYTSSYLDSPYGFPITVRKPWINKTFT